MGLRDRLRPWGLHLALLFGLLVQLGLSAAGITSARDPVAHDLPIGVAGPEQVSAPVAEQLQSQGGFSVTTFADEESGRIAIKDREVYAVFVPGQDQAPKLLIASAASPAVANLLTGLFSKRSLAQNQRLTVEDVVPLPGNDRVGASVAILATYLVLLGLAPAILIAFIGRGLPPVQRLVTVFAFANVAGLGVGGLVDPVLSTVPGQFWNVAAASGLIVFAVGAACVGLESFLGRPGIGLAIVLFFLFGSSTSAASSAPELLPGFFHTLNGILAPGLAVRLLRSAAYFSWHASEVPVVGLATYGLAGALMTLTAGMVRRDRVSSHADTVEVRAAYERDEASRGSTTRQVAVLTHTRDERA